MLKLFTFLTSFLLASNAYANEDWVKPASKIIELLEDGLVQLGAGAVGLGIIGFGLYTVFTGEGNWKKLGVIFAGGICVFFGPAIAVTLLEAVG